RTGLEKHFQEKKPQMKASLRGKSQLLLEVIDQDPEIAAMLANGWAEVVVERLNLIYGASEFSIANLEVEVENARQNWFSSQQELEDYLPQSKVASIDVELSQTRDTLNWFLTRIDTNRVIIEDSLSLESRLELLDPEQVLPLGDALSLIALQQRSSGEISGAEFQIPGNNLLGEQYFVQEARDSLTALINAGQNQNTQIDSEVLVLIDKISQLSVELESERHQVEVLTQNRDLARSTFKALSSQLAESRIIETQNGNTAKIGSKAVVANGPSSPSKIINGIIAGISGFFVTILGIFISEWWNAGGVNKKE
ncbi:MAG: hypothetical protein MUO76_14420, partial [Anaerolineaceae bacterium]|nr:hypothetical protein [Anaerolineaceae bacterium]